MAHRTLLGLLITLCAVASGLLISCAARPCREQAADYLKGRDIEIEVDLGTGGSGQSRMWTCDLSAEYVRINAEYRT